ncbi:MAG: class I SAM-dependent methyltransferase [Dehalococcoidales bacterium]|nr:class I SAM-dependent methyltransferase [Dehalococcoidales bacterium]
MSFASAVSETALITLKARVIESQKVKPVIEDPVALECFNRLQSILPLELRDRILKRKLPATLTSYIALRARKYDNYTRRFLEKYTDGLVVSLGCGFDTRYWRISKEPWRYIEVDLPDVIATKKEVLADLVTYTMIGGSVLEKTWMEEILSRQQKHVLFLAEGLFMYLPVDGVINLFRQLAGSFTESELVFEVVNEKYTKGSWKKIVASKMGTLGTQAGSSYDFGIRNAGDIEAYASNIKVTEEWSYFEDPDIKPAAWRLLRNMKLFTRLQWTIRALIS